MRAQLDEVPHYFLLATCLGLHERYYACRQIIHDLRDITISLNNTIQMLLTNF